MNELDRNGFNHKNYKEFLKRTGTKPSEKWLVRMLFESNQLGDMFHITAKNCIRTGKEYDFVMMLQKHISNGCKDTVIESTGKFYDYISMIDNKGYSWFETAKVTKEKLDEGEYVFELKGEKGELIEIIFNQDKKEFTVLDLDGDDLDVLTAKEVLKYESISKHFYCSHCHNTKIDETIEGGYSYTKECSCDIDHDLIDFYDKNK